MKEFWNTLQLVFAAVGGWLGYFLGGCDGLLYALLIFVICDYITGVMGAISDKKALLGGRLSRHLPQGADLHSGRHRKRHRHQCARTSRCPADGSHFLLHLE
jgi:hypothetical protein